MRVVHTVTVLCALIAFGAVGRNNTNTNGVQLGNRSDSLSYLLGRDVAEQLEDLGAEIQMDPFMLGFREAMAGDSSQIDSATADSLRQEFAMQAQQKMEQEQAQEAQEMQAKSEEFLAQNKERRGVRTTESGLQYEVLNKGSGPRPDSTDQVTVSYKGMLMDSTVFDSTAEGQPAQLDLQRVIPGMREGIMLMREGATYRFYIPPELAYGEQGIPPIVPPNAVLIFELTLMDITAEGKASRR